MAVPATDENMQFRRKINCLFFSLSGLTALHLALKKHSPLNNISCKQIIMELIGKGADVDIRVSNTSQESASALEIVKIFSRLYFEMQLL